MPIGETRRRIDGLISQMPVGQNSRQVLETGAEQFATQSSQQGAIQVQGQTYFGQQVQYLPASQMLAEIFSGASQGLDSAMRGIEEGDRRASQKAWDELLVQYYERESQGYDAQQMHEWLRSSGYRPDQYTQTQFAQLYARSANQSVAEWEQQDLRNEQLRFYEDISKSGTKMSTPIAQATYLQDLIDRSPNPKLRDWAMTEIIAINQKESERLMSQTNAIQQINWQTSLMEFQNNPRWAEAIAGSSDPYGVAVAVQTGFLQFDGDQVVMVTPDGNQEINLQSPNLQELLSRAHANMFGTWVENTEQYVALRKNANAIVGNARDKYFRDVEVTQIQTVELMMDNSHLIDADAVVQSLVSDPRLKLDTNTPEGRKTLGFLIRSTMQNRLKKWLDENPRASMSEINAYIEDSKKLPYTDQTAHLVVFRGAGRPPILNESGQEIFEDFGKDAAMIVFDHRTSEVSKNLVNSTKAVKDGTMSPEEALITARRDILDTLSFAGISVSPNEPIDWEGITKEYPPGTEIGNKLVPLRTREVALLEQVDKTTINERILGDPALTFPLELRTNAIDSLLDVEGPRLRQLTQAVAADDYLTAHAVAAEMGDRTRLLTAPMQQATPAQKKFIGDMLADPEDATKMSLAGTYLGELRNTRAMADILDSLDPEQRMSAMLATQGASELTVTKYTTNEDLGKVFENVTQRSMRILQAVRNVPSSEYERVAGNIQHIVGTGSTRDLPDDPVTASIATTLGTLFGPEGIGEVHPGVDARSLVPQPGRLWGMRDPNVPALFTSMSTSAEGRALLELATKLTMSAPQETEMIANILRAGIPTGTKLVMFPSDSYTESEGDRARPWETNRLSVMSDPSSAFNMAAMLRSKDWLIGPPVTAVGPGGDPILFQKRREIESFVDSKLAPYLGTRTAMGLPIPMEFAPGTTTETKLKYLGAAMMGRGESLDVLDVSVWVSQDNRSYIPMQGVPLQFKVNFGEVSYIVDVPGVYWRQQEIPKDEPTVRVPPARPSRPTYAPTGPGVTNESAMIQSRNIQ